MHDMEQRSFQQYIHVHYCALLTCTVEVKITLLTDGNKMPLMTFSRDA